MKRKTYKNICLFTFVHNLGAQSTLATTRSLETQFENRRFKLQFPNCKMFHIPVNVFTIREFDTLLLFVLHALNYLYLIYINTVGGNMSWPSLVQAKRSKLPHRAPPAR